MADQVLKAPAASDPNDPASLWSITWARIDRFLPKMKDDFIAPTAHNVSS